MERHNVKVKQLANQPIDGKYLYRYISIDKLLDFLINGRLAFTRLDVFEDKYEGITLNRIEAEYKGEQLAANIAQLGGTFSWFTIQGNPNIRNKLKVQQENYQAAHFVSCWYSSEYESVAMWKLYSNPDSVAIRIPHQELANVLMNERFSIEYRTAQSLTYGMVSYLRCNQLPDISEAHAEVYEQGFIKDMSFGHEQEFRLIIATDHVKPEKLPHKEGILRDQIDILNRERDRKIIHLCLNDFNAMPFEIIYHPQSQDWHRKNIKKVVEMLGLNFNLTESSLSKLFS